MKVDQLTNVEPNLVKKFDNYRKPIFHMKKRLHSFSLQPICAQKILKTINKMQNKSSCAHDQLCSEKIGTGDLNKFFNYSTQIFETHTFLKIWKMLKITPIHKSVSCDEAENYRSISILSAFGKLSENILLVKMINFATKIKILSSKQYGYQGKFSCVFAISDSTKSIRSSFDNK